MRACSTKFGSVPEDYALAGKYGIVAGTPRRGPMLCNNVHWNESEKGRWKSKLELPHS